MINTMNTLRTHKDSARFGFTEYSDLSDDEFLAKHLNRNLTKMTSNTNRRGDRPTTPISYNIMRYTRSTTDSIPHKIDW